MKAKTLICLKALFIANAMILCQANTEAQCVSSFTYSQTQPGLYSFINTSADTAQPTWYVSGPNLVYVNNATNPSFYFPVNGTYLVNLSSPYCQYIIDTIIISEATTSGTCQAGMTYYPTFASNFEFNDASIASDSIINYSWHAVTPDSFLMANGWTQNTDINLWSYNGCRYPFYTVSHSITTITGCQSSLIEKVYDYCARCGTGIEPGIIMHYDSVNRQVVFTDTVASGDISYQYWRFGTADNNTVFSTADSPAFTSFSDTLHVVCLDVYDTVNHCTASICDSINFAFPTLSTPVTNLEAGQQVDLIDLPGQLQIRFSNIALNRIEIYDMLGNRILTQPVSSSPVQVNLPPLSAGIYFVRMESGTAGISRKFFIK